MAKKRATAVKTLDDFIDEVNRCDYGRYEIGLNEDMNISPKWLTMDTHLFVSM